MNKIVLVVAAHPDDELLGVGGTVIKHSKDGDVVYALILGEGMMSRESVGFDDLNYLRDCALKASKAAGYKETFFSSFPDNSFDSVPLLQITKEVEKYIAQIKPQIIYTHHEYDLNIDHRMTCEAVVTACRPCNDDSPEEIYTFETLSSSEWQSKYSKQFQPNTYIDISSTIDDKIKTLNEYKTEMRDYPHSRSLDGVRILSQYRGLESGLRFAEAFCLIRKIKK